MEESVVRASIADIAAKASEIAGRRLKVELKVEPKATSAREDLGPAATEAGPDPVAIVERVFRGTRMPEKSRGERDELR